jgi:hypothetical protein
MAGDGLQGCSHMQPVKICQLLDEPAALILSAEEREMRGITQAYTYTKIYEP